MDGVDLVKMLEGFTCGLPEVGDFREDHGHTLCWVLGLAVKEIEGLRAEVASLKEEAMGFFEANVGMGRALTYAYERLDEASVAEAKRAGSDRSGVPFDEEGGVWSR